MKCPVCRATYRIPESSQPTETQPCHHCGADLSSLIALYDQAIGYHHQAIAQFVAGDLAAAIATNNQAIVLHSQHPKFHAFAGQLSALQGKFGPAIPNRETLLRLILSNINSSEN
jgi:hypothetical protein